MREIAQRELRNDSAAVLRAVEGGESITVTRRGVPVAALVPLRDAGGLRCAQAPTRRVTYADRPRLRLGAPSRDVLEDLRSDR